MAEGNKALTRSTEQSSDAAVMSSSLPRLSSGNRIAPLVFLYLAFTVVFTAPWVLLLLHAQSLDIGRGFVIHTQMWAPALAAFACCALFHIPFRFLGFAWPGMRAMAWGYFLPIAYATAAYLFVWLTGLAPADFAGFLRASERSLHIGVGAGVLNAALIGTFGVLQSGVSATGEEIGWRGFLVPALAQRFGFTGVALLSGIIWALWHYPLILFGPYSSPAPKWVAIPCFTVMIVATGAMAAWLRLKTGSVWPAAMFHACHNAVIQWLFDLMTVETGRAARFAGEFGLVLAVFSVLFAIPVWRSGVRLLAAARTSEGLVKVPL
jgi:membrane protease YdiL (CAAX protease family)